jgi:hypothetical protein
MKLTWMTNTKFKYICSLHDLNQLEFILFSPHLREHRHQLVKTGWLSLPLHLVAKSVTLVYLGQQPGPASLSFQLRRVFPHLPKKNKISTENFDTNYVKGPRHLPRINSSLSSSTRFTKSSNPRNIPLSSLPPKHFTKTIESIIFSNSILDSFLCVEEPPASVFFPSTMSLLIFVHYLSSIGRCYRYILCNVLHTTKITTRLVRILVVPYSYDVRTELD